MPYDPSITQRVRKAVKEATDQFLAIDVLLEHNERQDKLIAELNDKVGGLLWHHVRRMTEEKVKEAIKCALREHRMKVNILQRIVWVALIPISMAAGGFLVELLRKH
jgi:hypothetical protein